MARGCPCIGSNVGGIPELLEPDDLVKPGDPEALAKQIMHKLSSPSELARMTHRNLAMAKNYQPEQSQASEFAFLHAIRNQAVAGKSKALAKDGAFGIQSSSQSRSCSS
jgi:glycosyltransferase involved in cell wall biosynthesis